MASSGNRYWEKGYKEKRERQKLTREKRRLLKKVGLILMHLSDSQLEVVKELVENLAKSKIKG